ncbi:MAG: hypothetical protein J7500_12745 [Sphingomonas sp.]|uniref:hypothetical protein n=1 Tax=Sphingomonas sp. TaxID=28214 RepID=UPI001B0AB6D7|nr:hypothetical protein [Sphingomonas sp.]MBO9623569.1 hypothetical protein [Sphingomonas sp.]
MSGRPNKRRRAGALALAAAATVALTGCVYHRYPEERVFFSCDRGDGVVVIFRGNTAHVVGAQGGPMVLERRARGTFAFESPTRSAHLRGTQLTLTIGRMVPIQCRERGRRIPPGWHE